MSGDLRRYYRGTSLASLVDVRAGQKRVYHFDDQGTTQCLTNRAGAVTDQFASDAWGVPLLRTGTSVNRFWYIGAYGYDQAKMGQPLYARHRYLNQYAGRWISCDPIKDRSERYIRFGSELPFGSHPESWPSIWSNPSTYVYVANNPIYIDPLGLFALSVREKAKPGFCGQVTFLVGFKLTKKELQDGGVVVQHVKTKCNKLSCPPGKQVKIKCKEKDDDFWELLLIVKTGGKVFIADPRVKGLVLPILANKDGSWGADRFTLPDQKSCHGTQQATGKITYLTPLRNNPQIMAPAAWDWFGEAAHEPHAGQAPTTHKPQFNENAPGVKNHVLKVSWDCCKGRKKTVITHVDPKA